MSASADRVRRAGSRRLRDAGRGLSASVARDRRTARAYDRGAGYRVASGAAAVTDPYADDFERAVSRAIELGRRLAALGR